MLGTVEDAFKKFSSILPAALNSDPTQCIVHPGGGTSVGFAGLLADACTADTHAICFKHRKIHQDP